MSGSRFASVPISIPKLQGEGYPVKVTQQQPDHIQAQGSRTRLRGLGGRWAADQGETGRTVEVNGGVSIMLACLL